MEKRTWKGRLHESYTTNQFQMRTREGRGPGVKKSENFADVINGRSLERSSGDRDSTVWESQRNMKAPIRAT